MLAYLAVAAALAAADTSGAAPPPGGRVEAPLVVVHRQPGLPVVALRMSILAHDPPGYAGAGHLMQHLLQPRLQDQVDAVGGRVQLERTSDAIVFTVIGPAAELDHLSDVLLAALRPPRASQPLLLRATRELHEERLADWETAERHIRSALRAQLFPEDLPAAGTAGAGARLAEPGVVEQAWSRIYRPERVSVVAVGDVRIADVERAFGELPPAAPEPLPPLRDTAAVVPLAAAEATRGWLAVGYLASDLPPAALSVATRMVGDALRDRLPRASVEAEHWWTHHGQALVVVAAVPANELAAARRAVSAALATTRDGLTPFAVREAAKAVRRDMLFYSRTPDRMAEVIGAFTDRRGDADAAQRFYAALDAVDDEGVAQVLDALIERSPVGAEIPPQRLP